MVLATFKATFQLLDTLNQIIYKTGRGEVHTFIWLVVNEETLRRCVSTSL